MDELKSPQEEIAEAREDIKAELTDALTVSRNDFIIGPRINRLMQVVDKYADKVVREKLREKESA